jgi:GNAT superfamily N-acetyltransferase
MLIDRLTLDDLPAALALSTQAGWNQIEEDWRRLLDLTPEGCFAGRVDGRLVATATSASPAPGIRWIGMVLVDESCRGRGYGTRMLERAISQRNGPADSLPPTGGESAGPFRCADVVGLDATDLGRPLYLKLGFQDVAPIDRWVGVPRAGATGAQPTSLERVLELDRAALGADRSALLRRLFAEPGVRAWEVDDGYALLRPGRTRAHLGPLVAEDPLPLLRAATGRELVVDVPRRRELEAAFAAAGLGVQRRLTRMTLGAPRPVLLNAAGAVAFEWG